MPKEEKSRATLNTVRLFGLSNISLEYGLSSIYREIGLNRDSSKESEVESSYYPQVSQEIRKKAKIMSSHYELFYALEVSIRDMIRAQMETHAGADWWNFNVPQ